MNPHSDQIQQQQQNSDQEQSVNEVQAPSVYKDNRKRTSTKWIFFMIILLIVIFGITIAFYIKQINNLSQNIYQNRAIYNDQKRQITKAEQRRRQQQINDLKDEVDTTSIKLKQLEQKNSDFMDQETAILRKIDQTKAIVVAIERDNEISPKNQSKLSDIEITSPPISQLYTPVHADASISVVNFFKKNSQGKTIDQVLYNSSVRSQRKQFVRQRIKFIKSKASYPSLHLIKYNIMFDNSLEEQQKRQQSAQYIRLQQKFQFTKYPKELPMCVTVTGYNNNAKFRIENNLNSIFTQNYTNYMALIVDDASTDGGQEIITKYLDFYEIPADKYKFVANKERVGNLKNFFINIKKYCSRDSIVVNVDGDDEMIGKNVLKTFNSVYQKQKAGVVYTNFLWYQPQSAVMFGFTTEYSSSQKQQVSYRVAPMKFSHQRSFRAELFYQIDVSDFQDRKGNYYTIAGDMAQMFPLLEMSCGRVTWISGEYSYLYNMGTGLNDYIQRGKQVQVDNDIRSKKPYKCYEPFKKRMESLP